MSACTSFLVAAALNGHAAAAAAAESLLCRLHAGCYKLPWAGLLGIVPYSDSVISGGKLTPYGPHANGTVIIARCDTGNPPRNVSVTCKNGKWLADSLCRAPDASKAQCVCISSWQQQ